MLISRLRLEERATDVALEPLSPPSRGIAAATTARRAQLLALRGDGRQQVYDVGLPCPLDELMPCRAVAAAALIVIIES